MDTQHVNEFGEIRHGMQKAANHLPYCPTITTTCDHIELRVRTQFSMNSKYNAELSSIIFIIHIDKLTPLLLVLLLVISCNFNLIYYIYIQPKSEPLCIFSIKIKFLYCIHFKIIALILNFWKARLTNIPHFQVPEGL